MKVKRTSVVALVVAAAAAAPTASARLPVDPAGPVKQHRVEAPRVEAPGVGPGLAQLVARHESITNRQWQQAQSAPVKTLVRPEVDGFDWASAAIGAAVPLALLLVALLARPAIGRRRNRLAGVTS